MPTTSIQCLAHAWHGRPPRHPPRHPDQPGLCRRPAGKVAKMGKVRSKARADYACPSHLHYQKQLRATGDSAGALATHSVVRFVEFCRVLRELFSTQTNSTTPTDSHDTHVRGVAKQLAASELCRRVLCSYLEAAGRICFISTSGVLLRHILNMVYYSILHAI